MKMLQAASFMLLALHGSMAPAADAPASLTIGQASLKIEYANDPDSRAQGLMYRKTLEEDHGMLFRFDDTGAHCLWMKNTYVPLSAAFLDDDGVIINMVDLQPHDLQSRCAEGPSRYALEVNQGWFERHGVTAGMTAEGMPSASE